jgi:hypothetical protein
MATAIASIRHALQKGPARRSGSADKHRALGLVPLRRTRRPAPDMAAAPGPPRLCASTSWRHRASSLPSPSAARFAARVDLGRCRVAGSPRRTDRRSCALQVPTPTSPPACGQVHGCAPSRRECSLLFWPVAASPRPRGAACHSHVGGWRAAGQGADAGRAGPVGQHRHTAGRNVHGEGCPPTAAGDGFSLRPRPTPRCAPADSAEPRFRTRGWPSARGCCAGSGAAAAPRPASRRARP